MTRRIILQPPSFVIAPELPVQLEFCPLMGGPSWLPLHVQVTIRAATAAETREQYHHHHHKYDFVPRDATQPTTLLQLFLLQTVPGNVRYFAPTTTATTTTTTLQQPSMLVQCANEFRNQADPDLHLLYNNCWTFAWKLLRHLDQNAPRGFQIDR